MPTSLTWHDLANELFVAGADYVAADHSSYFRRLQLSEGDEYDFESVMNYSSTDASKWADANDNPDHWVLVGKPAREGGPPRRVRPGGDTGQPSAGDAARLRELYPPLKPTPKHNTAEKQAGDAALESTTDAPKEASHAEKHHRG